MPHWGSRGLEEVEDVPILCSVCKAKLNHTEAQNSELRAGDQRSEQVEEGVSSVNPECETEECSVFIPDSVGQSEQQDSVQDGGSLSLQCYTDPHPTESVDSSCTAAAQTPLKTCWVRLEDCRTMMELSGRSNNDFVLSGGDENWSPSSEDHGSRNRSPLDDLQVVVHREEKRFHCSLCQKSFSTSGTLKTHIKRHKEEMDFHCEECGKGFVGFGVV
ncbi:hypothetical protein MHYP_G00106020 [Metynnis hypsauchen]